MKNKNYKKKIKQAKIRSQKLKLVNFKKEKNIKEIEN